MSLLANFFYWFCRVFFKVYCPLQVEGKENLPHKPYILCGNHCSHMDTPVLMMATGLSFDCFGMIAAKDYFFEGKSKMSFFRHIIRLIPINRRITRETLNQDLANCERFIRETQGNLIFYPEGTRSLSGNLQGFKSGIGMMALRLGVPIVPVYIEGTFNALRKGWFFPRPHRIRVKIGVPITISEQATNVHYKVIANQLEFAVRQLQCGQEPTVSSISG